MANFIAKSWLENF